MRSYTALIQALAHEGNVEGAELGFSEMQEAGHTPDRCVAPHSFQSAERAERAESFGRCSVAYGALFHAYYAAKRDSKALDLLRKMLDLGFPLTHFQRLAF